jgi:hypothetical protein
MATLSDTQLESLRKALLQRESSNNYQARNQLGYIGGYQVGASTLETLGYLKKGSSKKGNSAVNDPANWTGKGGLKNVDDFLKSPESQDKVFAENIKFNQRVLKNKGTISKDTPPEELAGYLAASHLLGAGGASKDLTTTDANNVSGAKYFELGKQAVVTPSTPAISDAPYPEPTDKYKMEVLSKPNVNSPAGVKRVQKIIGADVDGVWGPQSQKMFDIYNRQTYDNTVNPVSATYREEQPVNITEQPTGFENPFLSVKNWWNSL